MAVKVVNQSLGFRVACLKIKGSQRPSQLLLPGTDKFVNNCLIYFIHNTLLDLCCLLVQILLESHKHLSDLFRHAKILNGV